MRTGALICIAGCLLLGCGQSQPTQPAEDGTAPITGKTLPLLSLPKKPPPAQPKPPTPKARPTTYHLVRVVVALCDNQHQGIARVSASLGNGQSPRTNLYWGAMYGLKTFFTRSPHWAPAATRIANPPGQVLDQAYFIHTPPTGLPVHVQAIAIDGQYMKIALQQFLRELAHGRSHLVCFVGHNGLMDTQLGALPTANRKTPAIIFSCQSDRYFRPILNKLGCKLLVSTYGNMAPEAYILDATLRAWAAGKPEAQLRNAAAGAYAKYQSCSLRAAQRLFGAR